MNDAPRHLTDDQIQEMLDGRLSRSEVGRLEAHVQACATCRAEVEGWRALVAELSALPSLAPGAGFRGRVLDAVGRSAEPRTSLASRIRALLGGRATPAGTGAHPDAGRLQDFLDGVLAGRSSRAVRAHVAACAPCRRETQALDGVMRGLAALPRLAPSAEFADAVMARVRIPEPAPARVALLRGALDRVRAFAGPRHRQAWAAAAGVALTPGVTLALMAYVVFSHPLVTLGSLARFLWIEAAGLTTAFGGGVLTRLVESAELFRVWSAVGALTRSPATAGLGLLAFSLLTLASIWILYSNLSSASVARAHANPA